MLWFVQEGMSALMLVCERGHISLVLTVLDSGAEINFQQKVIIGNKLYYYKINILISMQTTGQSAVYLAAKFGHVRVVRFLLAYGADPELMDWVKWKHYGQFHALAVHVLYDTCSQQLLLPVLPCKRVIQV